MLPGERITAIMRIGEQLGAETPDHIHLILGQFGINFSRLVGRDLYPQITSALADSPDSVLVGLQDFLFPGVEAGPGAEDELGGPWADAQFRLFISHRSEQKEFAGDLRRRLGTWGIDAFVAHDQIEPTQVWQEQIESALRTCDALAAILTPEFIHSEWCDQEVGFCMARGVLIVPVSIGADPYGFIGKYQRMNADLERNWREAARDLFAVLAASEPTGEKMTMPIVTRYAMSGSFDEARENFERLRAIPKQRWTPEMAVIVERAADDNTQISNAGLLGGGGPMPDAAIAFLDDVLERDGSAPQGTEADGPG